MKVIESTDRAHIGEDVAAPLDATSVTFANGEIMPIERRCEDEDGTTIISNSNYQIRLK